MKIIITGSLGNISKPLAQKLIESGHSVTVISSNFNKKKDIEAIGAQAAIGSLDDVAFLSKTFIGADSIYGMIPPNLKEFNSLEYYCRIGLNYHKAIAQSRVKRIVFLSSWGAHLDKGTGTILGSHHVEIILNRLEDINITHLRPCSIYYNLYNYVDMIKSAGIMGTNFKGEDKVAWVHPTDIAEVAAEELIMIPNEKQTIRYISSDEVTANDTARILGEAIGKPELKWISFTDEEVKQSLINRGLPEKFASELVDLNASISSGRMGEDYEQHKPTMGKVKMKEFAQEFAQVYNK